MEPTVGVPDCCAVAGTAAVPQRTVVTNNTPSSGLRTPSFYPSVGRVGGPSAWACETVD